MWGRKAREILDLTATVGGLRMYTGDLERRLATARWQAARIRRLVRGCARYRAELARAEQDVARLQARLDDACGLSHPSIADGEHWQTRRVDKPHPAAKEPTP
ncbi:hypothetical protein [Streptomyces lasiicapitis]|uniref:hypothetical protein n=1 Tax=Streptomyces lasiicapitis TaxID=1923961 RepID=UPI003667AB9A